MRKDVRVYTRMIEGNRALNYAYQASPDMGFRFHLLCEVGQPWQAEAKRKADKLAARSGCVIGQVELESAPWFVDALINKEVKNDPT